MSPKLSRNLVEELGVFGPIIGFKIVHRLDEPDTEESGPDPIDDGASEVLVVRRGDPFRQDLSRIGSWTPDRRRSVEMSGGDSFLRARNRQFTEGRRISAPNGDNGPIVICLARHPRE